MNDSPYRETMAPGPVASHPDAVPVNALHAGARSGAGWGVAGRHVRVPAAAGYGRCPHGRVS
jgi:hypothetical protein